MDEITRGELEKLHERISDLKERVVTLEAQQPHINAALLRIEAAMNAGFARIGRVVMTVGGAFLAPIAILIVRAAVSGGLSHLL